MSQNLTLEVPEDSDFGMPNQSQLPGDSGSSIDPESSEDNINQNDLTPPVSTVDLKLNLSKGMRVKVIVEGLSSKGQISASPQVYAVTQEETKADVSIASSPGEITTTILTTQNSNDDFDLSGRKDQGFPIPTSITRTVSILLGIGMIAVGFWLQVNKLRGAPIQTWITILGGLVLILVGIRPRDLVLEGQPRSVERKFSTWLGLKEWQFEILIAGIVLSLLAWSAAGYGQKMNLPWVAVAAWIGGMVLVLLPSWPKAVRLKKPPRGELLLVIGLVLAAFFVRGVNTTGIPLILTGDEGSAGLSAIEFIKGSTNNIFGTGWFSFPTLFFFLQSISIRLLGNTVAALRLPTALVGAITVGALYLMGKAMFGKWAGLFAATFLVAFHFHIHFSRIGLNNIWDGFWYIFVLGSLWYAWQKERREFFLLCGLGLGLSQYFYVSARALWVIVPAWVIFASLQDRTKLKRLLPDLFLMLILAFVAVFPLAMYFFHSPNQFLAPLARVTIFGKWMTDTVHGTGLQPWQVILQQISLSLQGFTSTPIRTFYDPQTPLLRPVPAALFLIGLVFLLIRLWDTRAILLVLWMAVFVVQGALSAPAPAAQRYVAVAPAAALVLGFSLAELARLLGRLWPIGIKLLYSLALILIILISLDDLYFYFYTYTPFSTLGGSNGMAAMQLARYLQEKDDTWEVQFFGTPYMTFQSIPSLPYLAPHIQGTNILHPWGAAENPTPNRENIMFVFLPNHQEDLEGVQKDFPGGKLIEERSWSHNLLYWLYEVEAIPQSPVGASP